MGMTDKQFNAYLRLVIDKTMQIKQEALKSDVSENVLKQIETLIDLLTESMKD